MAESATRLGLQVTQEELDIWRGRRNGTITGSINGFTYQSIYTNRILADANTFKNQSHPQGDGYWAGWTGAGCAPDSNNQGWAVGRSNGARLYKSAFHFLLTSDVTYATPVFTELLNLTTVPGVDFSNRSKWCIGVSLVNSNMLEMTAWMNRLVFTYDFLQAGGFTGWTVPQKAAIQTWLYNMATAFRDGYKDSQFNNTGYQGIFNTPQTFNCTTHGGSFCSNTSGTLYFNGPTLFSETYWGFFNQPAGVITLMVTMGLLANDPVLLEDGKKMYRGFLTAGTFDNGAIGDFIRWHDCAPGCPQSMWGHATGPYGALIQTADTLARTGDKSLYDYTVNNVTLGQTGQSVNLRKSVKLWADMVNNTVQFYATTSAAENGQNQLRLSWNTDTCCGGAGLYWDFVGMAANVYLQEATVRTAMNRTSLSINDPWNGCNDSQFGGCFVGNMGAQWPDLPFMYGNLDSGQIDPYTIGTSNITGSGTLTQAPQTVTGAGTVGAPPTLEAPSNFRILR